MEKGIDNLRIVFERFLEQLGGSQSKFNRRNYTSRLKLFLEWFGELSPASVAVADVNRWHDELKSRGYAEATLAGYRQSLKALFNFAEREGLLERNPASHLTVGSFVSRRPKLPPETAVLRAVTIANGWIRTGTLAQVRDGLIFLLSVVSGPRLGEIQNLKKSEIEAALSRGPNTGGIYIAQSYGKTKDVDIRFTEHVAAGLRYWLKRRPDCRVDVLFCGLRRQKTISDKVKRYRPLSRSGITKAYQRIAEAAELDKAVLSHALRHRLGDTMTKRFGPKAAAIALNHKDRETAATAIAFYHHPDEAYVSKAISQLAIDPKEVEEMSRLFGRLR